VLSFRAVNPTPQICCLSPTSAVAAGPAFALTVFGHNFDPDASVNWNGSKRTTTFVNSTELRAAIPSSDIASPGANSVSVSSSDGATSARSFQVAVLPQGAPIITTLNPAIIPAGTGAFTLQVNGSNFVPASVVQYHGQDRNTTFVSDSMLTASILANDVRAGSTFNITVVNPPASGPNQDATVGVTGNAAVVVVTNPIPAILSLNPTTATPGSPSVSLSADGIGFVTDVSQVRWNGQPRATTIADTTRLSAQAIASDVTDPGISIVTVSNSGPGGGMSNAMTFTTIGTPVAARTLYYPRLLSKTGFDNNTGIAITNTGQNIANLTLRALSTGGTDITAPNIANPVSISLSAREQLAKVDSEIFGAGLHDTNKAGWMKVESTQGDIAGFFLAFNDSVSVLDGAEVSSATLTSLVFPEVENPGFTQIHLVNPNTAATTVMFELYKSDGTLRTPAVSRTISSNGVFAEQLADLFPDITPDASDSLRASSTRGVVALEYLGKATDYAHVLKGQDAATGATTLFSPQFVIGGPWRSSLSVLNLDSSAGNVTLEFIGDNGTVLGSAKTVAVAAKGKIYISDQKFFFDSAGVETTGYVRITSTVRLAGAVVFGDSERATFSAALPLVSTLLSSFTFGHIASNDDYFTGIATLNPSGVDVTVTIEVFSRNGDLVQSKTETLPALRRTSRVLTQIFPDLTGQDINSGYIKITANSGLASFAVFGTQSLSALAAIPPQVP
jgi:hypothetical protein